MATTPSRPTDPLLGLEVALTLVLIGLGISLYVRPAAAGLASAAWWHWLVLAGFFFGVVTLHGWRRRRAARQALRRLGLPLDHDREAEE